MSPKSLYSLVILSVVLCGISSALPGGWYETPDLKEPLVQDAATFAVAEYNNKKDLKIIYESVIDCREQVVAGLKYHLIIKAKDEAGGLGKYEAIVWVKPWLKFKKLISFKKLAV